MWSLTYYVNGKDLKGLVYKSEIHPVSDVSHLRKYYPDVTKVTDQRAVNRKLSIKIITKEGKEKWIDLESLFGFQSQDKSSSNSR